MKKYNNKISASVMCSDLLNLEKDIRTLENLGVDMLHIDVMDAHFVPNLTFGPDFIKAMQARTHLPVDCHFMVTEPDLMYSKLQMRKGDIFTVHAEVDRDYRYMADPLHPLHRPGPADDRLSRFRRFQTGGRHHGKSRADALLPG